MSENWQQQQLAEAYIEFQKSQAQIAVAPYAPAQYAHRSKDTSLVSHRQSDLVPQRTYEPPHGKAVLLERTPVKYDMNGRGYISLSDALAGRFDGLERAHEFAFSDRSLKKSFRLEWPVPSTGHGYSSYARQITVRDSTKSVNPITVARLARKVAEEVKRFIELNENVVIDDPLWRVGPGYITLDRLLLVEVRQVSEESIQPVLRLTVDRG